MKKINKGMVFVISGAPAVGKTTLIKKALTINSKTVHIQVDKLRAFVKTGYASPDTWDVNTEIQYRIARAGAAFLAKEYAQNGYWVFVDDVFRDSWKRELVSILGKTTVKYIYLRDDIENILQGNSERSYVVEPKIVRSFYKILEKENTERNGWVIINNETVEKSYKELVRIVREDNE